MKIFGWQGTIIFLLILLMIGTLFSGCALTPPSSEALIFKKDNSNNHPKQLFSQAASISMDQEKPFRPSNPNPLNILFSVSARPRLDGELEYAKDKYASFVQETLAEDPTLTENDLTVRNPYYFSLSFPVTLINRKKIRWALNVGYPVLGMDATTNLASNTYITANLGFGDGEVIVQQKIYQNKTLGIALGGYYRAERRGFEIERDQLSLLSFDPIADRLSADRIFYNHIIGARVNSYLDIGDWSNSFLMFRAAPGYAFNLKQPIINFSLSFRFGS